VVLVVAGAAGWRLHRPKPLYRVTFLPSMGGVQTCPGAINDSGQVVAAVRMADGTNRVVLWDKSGRIEELGSFPVGSTVFPMAINNAGQVACTVSNDPNRTWNSFFWDVDRRRYALNNPGVAYVEIHGMNNHGQVVGCRGWPLPEKPAHAFLWDKATGMQDVGLFNEGESVARGINDQGQIVGFFTVDSLGLRTFVYDPNLGVQDLGFNTGGGNASCLINNGSFVVGQFNSAQPGPDVSTWTAHSGVQPLLWKGDGVLRIRGLNDAGCYFVNVRRWGIQVGGRELWGRSECHLWQFGRHVRQITVRLCCGDDLRHRNVTAVSGWDINEDGTILAGMTIKGSGRWQAVILEPIR